MNLAQVKVKAINSTFLGVYSNTSLWLSVHRLWRTKLIVCDSVPDPEVKKAPDPGYGSAIWSVRAGNAV
jgi:hypothetical protein